MTGRSLEIRAGVSVVAASLILIVGIMWFQRFKLVERRYNFYVKFPEVGGLTKDDPIMINGVERGRVKEIYLQKFGVLVEMGVKEKVSFPEDSRITLRSIGIMGERFVSIRSGGSNEVVQPGDTLVGELEAGLSEVMGETGKVLGELVQTSSSLKEILEVITEEERLRASMENFRIFSKGLRAIVDEEDSPLYNAVRALKMSPPCWIAFSV